MGMFSQLAQGVDWSSMGAMALRIVAVLLCLVVHEVCHGLAAYWLGDPTAKQSHRLSLNPIHHLDPAHRRHGSPSSGRQRTQRPHSSPRHPVPHEWANGQIYPGQR